MYLDSKNIMLLTTGSFNPPTNMHLRLFGKILFFVETANVYNFDMLLFRNRSRSLVSFGVQHFGGFDITSTRFV